MCLVDARDDRQRANSTGIVRRMLRCREERPDRQEEACQRQDDEEDLVDVVCAGREISQEVDQPEHGVEPKCVPRPPFGSPVRNQDDQCTEEAKPDRSETVRTIQGGVFTARNHNGHDTKKEDGQADDRQADPADPHHRLDSAHEVTLYRVSLERPGPVVPRANVKTPARRVWCLVLSSIITWNLGGAGPRGEVTREWATHHVEDHASVSCP